MRCDREKLPKPNLHMYGKDDTKIMIYNIRRSPKKIKKKKPREKRLRNKSLKEKIWTLD